MYKDYDNYWSCVEEYPCHLMTHCSDEYRMWVLGLRKKTITAKRGYAEEIDPAKLTVTDEERAAFKKWLDDHGVTDWCEKNDISPEPVWNLVSYWG